MSVYEFFETVGNSERIGNWWPTNKRKILLLNRNSQRFYHSNLELHANFIIWEDFEKKIYIDSGTWGRIIIILLDYKQ